MGIVSDEKHFQPLLITNVLAKTQFKDGKSFKGKINFKDVCNTHIETGFFKEFSSLG